MGNKIVKQKTMSRAGVKKWGKIRRKASSLELDQQKPEKEHNWKAIKNWLRVARRDLKRLETDIADPKKRSQKVLWEGMQMLMNSLAYAWTSRYATDEELAKASGATYKQWMKFPAEFVGKRMGNQPSDQ